MNQVYAKLQNCYECVRKKTDFVPKVRLFWDRAWAIMRNGSVW